MGGNDEKEQTLNQLLVELDGFDPTIGLILLAATNRPEILDPALLRAGRFDRQVLVDRPDKRGRVDILNVHFKKAVLASDVDPEQIAALTTGFTGADLANLINEAALLATRRGADRVHLEDFTAAIERIVAGLEKRNRILNPFEHRVVAYHELGHAIVAMALPDQDPVHKVSIIPRGIGALGYTIQRPTEDRFLMTQDELENRMAVLLGGRAAEAVVFHHLSTGAADDLAKATDIARSMVMRYGMDKQLGHVTYAREKQTMLGMPTMPGAQDEAYSEETERSIDHALHDLMQRAFDRATSILTRNRDVLEKTAQVLLEKETLEKGELDTLRAQIRPEARSETLRRRADSSHRRKVKSLRFSRLSHELRIAEWQLCESPLESPLVQRIHRKSGKSLSATAPRPAPRAKGRACNSENEAPGASSSAGSANGSRGSTDAASLGDCAFTRRRTTRRAFRDPRGCCARTRCKRDMRRPEFPAGRCTVTRARRPSDICAVSRRCPRGSAAASAPSRPSCRRRSATPRGCGTICGWRG